MKGKLNKIEKKFRFGCKPYVFGRKKTRAWRVVVFDYSKNMNVLVRFVLIVQMEKPEGVKLRAFQGSQHKEKCSQEYREALGYINLDAHRQREF